MKTKNVNGMKKKGIAAAIALMAVGFAAISTTLYINGTVTVGANTSDFAQNVIFTSAKLTYKANGAAGTEQVATLASPTATAVNKTNVSITNNGKAITFSTPANLTMLNDNVELEYTVSNFSQYTADVKTVVCKEVTAATSGTTAGSAKTPVSAYITPTSVAPTKVLAAKSGTTVDSDKGKFTATLSKSYASESNSSIYYQCVLTATAGN